MAKAHLDPEGWAKKVKKRRILLSILAAVLLLGGGSFWLLKTRILPEVRNSKAYSQAEEALARGELPEAIDRFSVLGAYRDAASRAAELAYAAQPDDSFRRMIGQAKLGDTIRFGLWEQDGKPENGPEPIEWFVLADDDGRVLLWADRILDQMPYHSSNTDITWADCSLRAWLNDSFYRTAFRPEEQLLIAMTENVNADNPASGTKGGENTEDHVCIPSYNELVAFYFYNPRLEGLYAYPTPYAVSQGADTHSSWGTSPWWLRNSGVRQSCAGYCDMGGKPLYSGIVNHRGYGVRPMLWVFDPGRVQTQPEE